MKNFFKYLFLISLLLLTSCFESLDSVANKSISSEGPKSELSVTDFPGAVAATNKVTGIEISWVPATKEVSGYKVYRVQGKNLNLLTSLPPTVNAFIDGSVWWGTIYTYVVRAIDKYGIEETNLKQVSAVSWAGINRVEATSRTSLKIYMEAPAAIADEVRIYIRPLAGEIEKTLVATVTGSDIEIPIEELRAGYGYKISAQAYVGSLKKEDGNELEFTVNTNSFGYHYDGADFPKWNSVINVRAFGESPGTIVHPSEPDKSPKLRLVELAFNSFFSMSSNTKYVVIRAKEGYPLNTNTTKSCSESEVESCKVCEVSGAGVLVCKDRTTAPSPMRYRYTMALVHSDNGATWTEEFPQSQIDNYSILVPIPPENMVLVQRDAANYEMCQLMNKGSDPINHNRCVYAGNGAIPYSSGNNKPALNRQSGYYDFGYNLFVDRYELGCNWTKASSGGKCGAGATDGDCVGEQWNGSYPSNAIGIDGNVYWALDGDTSCSNNCGSKNVCYMKVSGAWKRLYELQNNTNPEQYFASAVTNNPASQGGQIPVIMDWSARSTTSSLMCASSVDANYGAKRIPRMREHRVFTAWPNIPNEPYYTTATQSSNYINGVTHDSTSGYRCFANGNTSELSVTSIAELLTPGNEKALLRNAGARGGSDFMGSSLSSDCQSRYGVRSSEFGTWHPVSDYFYYETSPVKKLIGAVSPLDNGNIDLNYDINGSATGYKILASDAATSASDYYMNLNNTGNHNFVNLALGLPVFLSSSSDYMARALFPGTANGNGITLSSLTATAGPRQVLVRNRMETYIGYGWNGLIWRGVSRCVLPAE